MKLQYWHPRRGWWTGHQTFSAPDPEAYVAGCQLRVRVLDGSQVYEQEDTRCTVCGEHHEGRDGSCLI